MTFSLPSPKATATQASVCLPWLLLLSNYNKLVCVFFYQLFLDFLRLLNRSNPWLGFSHLSINSSFNLTRPTLKVSWVSPSSSFVSRLDLYLIIDAYLVLYFAGFSPISEPMSTETGLSEASLGAIGCLWSGSALFKVAEALTQRPGLGRRRPCTLGCGRAGFANALNSP